MKMISPDYKGGSIVNLMSSVYNALGQKNPYPNLRILRKDEIKECKNVVLIVLDGLGFNQLKRQGEKTALLKHLSGRMTSVWPATTAAAVTTFYTGLAPRQHAVTGWYMQVKELGMQIIPLTFMSRFERMPLSDNEGKLASEIFSSRSKPPNLNRPVFAVCPKEFKSSVYNSYFSQWMSLSLYHDLPTFFGNIEKLVKKRGKKYVYAYWPGYDKHCHEFGADAKKTKSHLRKIDAGFRKLLKSIEGTDTMIIVTADHGLVDVKKKDKIIANDVKRLGECLSMPLAGETRMHFAYVKPSKIKQFKSVFKKELKGRHSLFRSEDLVKRGFFGLFESHDKLLDRLGDYVMIAHEGQGMVEDLAIKKEHSHIGHHGGVSEDEMYVPLIVVRK
ncbi:alkaline phosphatase family protein [Candidatus Woesearchaeota archaeon]|nr:alkaline phosphatase family protein [Candidatus Woesearchaeota archaeon]